MPSVDSIRQALEPERGTRAGIALRAARRYLDDGMADRAPALAYYGTLSLFPMLLIAIGLVRFVGGSDAPTDLADFAADHGASGAFADTVRSATATARDAPAAAAGSLGGLGVLTLIYGASRAFTAAGRALDATGGQLPRPRSIRQRLADMGWTLVLLVVGVVAIVLLALSGRLLEELLGLFGLSGAAVTVWSFLRWPAAIGLMLFAFAVVRWTAPTASHARFRFLSLGAMVTVGIWVVTTVGYAFYVSEIASYNATYGAFTGAIILMLWIWLGSCALLYGAEIDAVREERVQVVRPPGGSDRPASL